MTMKNRRVLIGLGAAALLVIIAVIVIVVIIPGSTQPVTVGTPVITSQFGDIKTKPKAPTATPTTSAQRIAPDQDNLVSFRVGPKQKSGLPQFQSCTELRGATATPQMTAQPAGTLSATQAATIEPTIDAATIEPDYIVLSIVGAESEACYQVGEIFLDGNEFNMAIGVSHAIAGEIAIDRANIANSKVGDIVIDVSQFQSDEPQRDGRIRRQWLESNNFPLMKFSNAKVSGLPVRPYQDGETLHFQITGDMTIREVTKEKTFTVTATLKDGTLMGTATLDFLMTDFGFDPPNIANLLKANNEVHAVLNFVAREPNPDATPAA
jgi:polyisoprenoid-binding protein YceI